MSGNAERNAEIVRRRIAGEPCCKISQDMGLSKGTVIGVCFRAGVILHDRAAATAALVEQRPMLNFPRAVKLCEASVRQIRQRYLKGDLQHGQSAIAREYGVTAAAIAHVVHGLTWKHVA